VKVPVAAPNIALDLTSVASFWSERPRAEGNCEARGRWAAASRLTAGGGAALEEDAVLLDAAALELEDVFEEDPQPAISSAQAASVAGARSFESRVMVWIMSPYVLTAVSTTGTWADDVAGTTSTSAAQGSYGSRCSTQAPTPGGGARRSANRRSLHVNNL
jgi:hypothetical protein